MTDVTLGSIARELVDSTDSVDVESLAGRLVVRWREVGLEHDALMAAAREAVTTAWRMRPMIGAHGSGYGRREFRPTAPGGAPLTRSEPVRREVTFVAWVRKTRLNVAPGHWILLDNCTSDNLLGIAQKRYDLAHANSAQGDRLTRLAKVLEHQGLSTVSDLPDEDLEEILEGQAVN
jgi:hypothetical protein